jgi:6-phosphofructokinase 1
MEGLLNDALVDLSAVDSREIERLRATPGASLGSTRYKPSDGELQQIAGVVRRQDIRSLLLIGGNGSLRGAEAIAAVLDGVSVIGIPKTIDNDIHGTDRCPGFASAARYVAHTVRDLGIDVRTLPPPVSIFETMGRSVGWLAGASVLAKCDDGDAPHLIYLPERAFDEDRFIDDIDRVVRKRGWAVVVVAEGIKNASGRPVYDTSEVSQRDALDRPPLGGVAAHLAELASRRLKIRCRWEKPGLIGRCSPHHVSAVDRADAEAVGRHAVRAAMERQSGVMVALSPLAESRDAADIRCDRVPLTIARGERCLPPEWLSHDPEAVVTSDYVRYASRLVGPLLEYPPPLSEKRV